MLTGHPPVLRAVTTSVPARVRLYAAPEAARADAARPVTVDACPGCGLLVEVVTTLESLTVPIALPAGD